METLKIEKRAALTAHDQATPKQKTMLENLFGKNIFSKNIRDRIQSEADIFELNNTTEEEFSRKWENHSEYEKAHAFELLIVAAYCGGSLPDMTDGTTKYSPYFKMGSPAGVGFAYYVCVCRGTDSDVGSRQLFHGPDAYKNMLDAVKKFLPHYQKSRTL
jgi:hypothetical protein